jgi:hypothetical protein
LAVVDDTTVLLVSLFISISLFIAVACTISVQSVKKRIKVVLSERDYEQGRFNAEIGKLKEVIAEKDERLCLLEEEHKNEVLMLNDQLRVLNEKLVVCKGKLFGCGTDASQVLRVIEQAVKDHKYASEQLCMQFEQIKGLLKKEEE